MHVYQKLAQHVMGYFFPITIKEGSAFNSQLNNYSHLWNI